MGRPFDDLVLNIWLKVVEVGAVPGHAHHDPWVGCRVFLRSLERLRVEHIGLDLHPTMVEVVPEEVHQCFSADLPLDGLLVELHVQSMAVRPLPAVE